MIMIVSIIDSIVTAALCVQRALELYVRAGKACLHVYPVRWYRKQVITVVAELLSLLWNPMSHHWIHGLNGDQ